MENQNIFMGTGERTVLTRANDQSYSLRSTVPKFIVSNFDLKAKDYLFWKIEGKKSGKGIVIIVVPKHRKSDKSNINKINGAGR